MARKNRWWWPFILFAGHVLIGGAMFIVFGAATMALALLVQSLDFFHVPRFTMQVITLVERTILIIDTVVYLAYVLVIARKFVREVML